MNLNNISKQSGVPPLFQDRVTLRVTKASFGNNSRGLPMSTLTCEIVAPATLRGGDGKEYDASGEEVTLWLTYSEAKSEKQKRSGMENVAVFHKKLNLPMELDEHKVEADKLYGGLMFDILAKTTERKSRRIVGKNEETGKAVYEDIKDGEGNVVTSGWQFSVNPEDVFGPATAPEGQGILTLTKGLPL